MTRLLAWAKRVLARIWSRPVEAAAPAPVGHNKPKRQRVPKAERETFGAYYYLDTILDDLGDYFEALRQLRRHDPQAFSYYSRVGAQTIGGRDLWLTVGSLPAAWRDRAARPMMGMLHMSAEWESKADKEDRIVPSFVYFQKQENQPGVEYTRDDLFEVTVFYRDRRNGEAIGTGTFYVAVAADNSMRPLRVRTLEHRPVAYRRAHSVDRRSGQGTVPQVRWRYPVILTDLAKENGGTSEQVALGMFTTVASAVENAADGVQVRAKRDGLAAIFNVDMLRTPYFFKDREKTVTENGRTKKIFHIARAHRRVTAGGTETFVRTHFRGQRRFTWNGYAVTISMPGLHHGLIQRIAATARVVDEHEEVSGYLDSRQLGQVIDTHLSGEAA